VSEAKDVVVEHRLGRIEVEEADVLHFESGLPGFPRACRFAVLPYDGLGPLFWLVCLDDAQLAFVVVDPRLLFPDYSPQIEAHHLHEVAAETLGQAEILAMATIRDKEVTVNLAAPLLMNLEARRGVQVILEPGEYPLRQPLPEATKMPAGVEQGPVEAKIQP